jgi:hypothetical protein
VFAGTTMAPYDIISGRLEGIERWFAKEDVRPLMHSVPALSWLAPQPEVRSMVINEALPLGEACQYMHTSKLLFRPDQCTTTTGNGDGLRQ